MKALIITTNGGGEIVELTKDFPGRLTELQRIVGGHIESAPTDGSVTIYVNEEGKLMDLPVNFEATFSWWEVAPWMRGADVLCGNVVIVGPPDHFGDDTDLPADHQFTLRYSNSGDE